MRLREYSEAIPKPMVNDRLPADPVARHEVLRALRAQGLHPVPGLQGRRHQGVLPPLRGVDLERLRRCREGGKQVELESNDIEDWNITFVDTGLTPTSASGSWRCAGTCEDEEMFLANYCDGLTDLDLPAMIDALPARADKVALLPGRRRRRRASTSWTSKASGEVASHPPGHRVRPADQRRVLRAPPRDLRLHRAGRGARRWSRSSVSSQRGQLLGYQLRPLLGAWTPSRSSSSSRICHSGQRAVGGLEGPNGNGVRL